MIKKPYFFIYNTKQFTKNIEICAMNPPTKIIGFEQYYIPLAYINIETKDISYTEEFTEEIANSKGYRDILQYIKEHIFFNNESNIEKIKLKLKEYVANDKIKSIRLYFYEFDSNKNISYVNTLINFGRLESYQVDESIESIKMQEHDGLFKIYDISYKGRLRRKQLEILRERLEN